MQHACSKKCCLRSVVCDVCGVVLDFGKSDCGVVWEVARRHKELEGEKGIIGVQTEASDDVKRDDETFQEVCRCGEIGQVEPIEQTEQVEQVDRWSR